MANIITTDVSDWALFWCCWERYYLFVSFSQCLVIFCLFVFVFEATLFADNNVSLEIWHKKNQRTGNWKIPTRLANEHEQIACLNTWKCYQLACDRASGYSSPFMVYLIFKSYKQLLGHTVFILSILLLTVNKILTSEFWINLQFLKNVN